MQTSSFFAIDEVGRGCLAGPVQVCVSFWLVHNYLNNAHSTSSQASWIPLIKDSKKLSAKKRSLCYEKILSDFQVPSSDVDCIYEPSISFEDLVSPNQFFQFSEHDGISMREKYYANLAEQYKCVGFYIGAATPSEIDALNIWKAVQLASARAFSGFNNKPELSEEMKKSVIFMDGNKVVKVPKKFQQNTQVAIINGDDIFMPIGFSSIVAKVYRDNHMESQHSLFPNYGFDAHKGYGTAKHIMQIQNHGACSLHRQSFLKNIK